MQEALRAYLLDKLALGPRPVDKEMGRAEIKRTKEPKNKNKEEYIVTFENKHA